MAVTFFPFNSIVVDGVPDRPANAENLAAYLAGFFSNGVLMQTDTALKVEASSGMNVQIRAGMGNINGKTIIADAAEVITIDTASASLARIDRVVFRLDEVNRLMEFDVLKGTPASSPVAPALTQRSDVYELCLAEIRVPAGATSIIANYITDTRVDADLCGVASIAPHMQDLEHGGTGISAETVEALLLALGGTRIKKVWSNASPTSAFPEQYMTIKGISKYPMILAFARENANSVTETMAFARLGVTSRLRQFYNYRQVRSFDYKANDEVWFSHGKEANYNTTVADLNTVCVPTVIYGIEGVL